MEMLTVAELAARLEMSEVHVRSMVKEGQLLAVRQDNVPMIAARELDGTEPVKHLPAVLRLLRDAGYSDDEAFAWLTTEDESLPGSPLDALQENRATEVKRRAQALGF